MPRYFFDFNDGEMSTSDYEGVLMESPQCARDAAFGVLPGLAAHSVPSRDERAYVAVVRNESGAAIFRAELTLATKWLV